MSIYTRLMRPLLFRLNAELVHQSTVEACCWAGWMPGMKSIAQAVLESQSPDLQIEVAGLRFANPLGLAAGWDKSGRALHMLNHLGFGFAEIGSISAQPSLGNPRPRLFRITDERAIVVNYGLPNDGAQIVAKRLAKHRPRIPLGVNIVTTNHGPTAPLCSADEILADYVQSVSLVHQHASYLTLNLSCPNALDGRDFFALPGRIAELLERLRAFSIQCPVFLKLPPSEDAGDHERWLTEVEEFDFVRGFMFNLAPGKPQWLHWKHPQSDWSNMPGAVSGAPVAARINSCIAGLASRMDRQRYAIIGGGGVFSAEDAWQKIERGAALVQIYTALIYEGPGIVRRINKGLSSRLRERGMNHLSEAVGSALKDH